MQGGHDQAAVRQEHTRKHLDRLLDRRKGGDDQRVPEQQVEQQRHVAEGLHIGKHQSRQHGIVRQPPDADQQTENGAEQCREQRDFDRIGNADEDRTTDRIGRLVGDRGFRDDETGLARQEAETGRDILLGKIGACGAEHHPGDEQHDADGDHLIEIGANARIIKQGHRHPSLRQDLQRRGSCRAQRSLWHFEFLQQKARPALERGPVNPQRNGGA
ncbi:hypothetical protein D9M70_524450 [compost metagenome]